MTDDCVVDSSVAVKWALDEPDSPDADRVVVDVAAVGGTLVLLDLADIETANAVWVQHRRKRLTVAEALTALADLRQMPLHFIEARPHLDDAFALALQYNIAVYDALFVAAVRHLGCRGVTADSPLVTAVGGAFPAITRLADW